MISSDEKRTLDYYKENADTFFQTTVSVDFSKNQEVFLSYIKRGSHILDFGCGCGRDSKYFLEKGFIVDATDGSEDLCKLASAYTGLTVRRLFFHELSEENTYDAVWACASILHVKKQDLPLIFKKICRALKDEGILYTSFKYGELEGFRGGRYYTDFTRESFDAFHGEYLRDYFVLLASYITSDVRPGMKEEKWLNLILKKI